MGHSESHKSSDFFFVFATITLESLSQGMALPILPKLLNAFCNDVSQTAKMLGLFASTWALLQFFLSPLIGALSDRFGRKPLLMVSNWGLGLNNLIVVLAPNLTWLFASRIIGGGTSSSITVGTAYVLDNTPLTQRPHRLGLVSVVWSLGLILGPALGGILGDINTRLPFIVAACLSLINAIFGQHYWRETHVPYRKQKIPWRQLSPFAVFLSLPRKDELLRPFLMFFAIVLNLQVFRSVYALYASRRFGWGPRMVGIAMCLLGILSLVVVLIGLSKLLKYATERNALRIGLAAGALGFIVLGSASSGHSFVVGMCIFGCSSICGPLIQTIISYRVPPEEMGKVQGSLTSLAALAGIFGPGVFTYVFQAFIDFKLCGWDFTGAPFFLAATLIIAAATISRAMFRTGNA